MIQANELEIKSRSSTPTFLEFDPFVIPYQGQVIDDVFFDFDYSKGTHEILLSGSVGSAKSILMAHLAVRHCIMNEGALLLLGRKSMPDLKATIFQKIKDHMEMSFQENVDYAVVEYNATIEFKNGSKIISRSWSDRKFKKVRSLELSAAIIEELTENEEQEPYDEIKMRVGRLAHISQNQSFICCASNPDSPAHWAYKYFIDTDIATRHVYYSVTTDNPFLPESYVNQLKTDLDPKLARRMIYGEWIEISTELVYYAYKKEDNYRDTTYKINLRYPISISWDFNIGQGKPLSAVIFQFIDDVMYIFDEVVVEGMRTNDSCDELSARGLLDYNTMYMIHGDATGRHRDTRNVKSDYDIIRKFFSNYRTKNDRRVEYELHVPLSNGAIRKRHNLVNSYCDNEAGDKRLFVYKKAKTANEGLRLTKLKKGGQYIEDDSPNCPYQHISTAIGYGLAASLRNRDTQKQGSVQL